MAAICPVRSGRPCSTSRRREVARNSGRDENRHHELAAGYSGRTQGVKATWPRSGPTRCGISPKHSRLRLLVRRHLHRLPGARKRRIWPWLLGIAFVLVLIGRCSDGGNQSSQTSPSASPSRSASPTSKEPFPTEYLPGNGTYEMGGIDGKDWGIIAAGRRASSKRRTSGSEVSSRSRLVLHCSAPIGFASVRQHKPNVGDFALATG